VKATSVSVRLRIFLFAFKIPNSSGGFGEAFGWLAWPETARNARAKLSICGGARRGEVEKRESTREGNEDGWRSGWRRVIEEDMLELTSGVAVDVWPPRGVHTSAGRRLTKLNLVIQSPSVVTETQCSSTFYS